MDEPEAKQLRRIEGQIAAIGMVLRTLIESHSNPKALRNRVQAQRELLQSSLRSRGPSDDVTEGAHPFVNRWIQKGDEQQESGLGDIHWRQILDLTYSRAFAALAFDPGHDPRLPLPRTTRATSQREASLRGGIPRWSLAMEVIEPKGRITFEVANRGKARKPARRSRSPQP